MEKINKKEILERSEKIIARIIHDLENKKEIDIPNLAKEFNFSQDSVKKTFDILQKAYWVKRYEEISQNISGYFSNEEKEDLKNIAIDYLKKLSSMGERFDFKFSSKFLDCCYDYMRCYRIWSYIKSNVNNDLNKKLDEFFIVFKHRDFASSMIEKYKNLQVLDQNYKVVIRLSDYTQQILNNMRKNCREFDKKNNFKDLTTAIVSFTLTLFPSKIGGLAYKYNLGSQE